MPHFVECPFDIQKDTYSVKFASNPDFRPKRAGIEFGCRGDPSARFAIGRLALFLLSRRRNKHKRTDQEKEKEGKKNQIRIKTVVMSILEELAKISNMEVNPTDKNQSPCFQRHQILKKIETERMILKTFKELHQKYHNSDPSLTETTIDAADEHQLKLDALVSERDSLPECQTFNCQFCPKSIHTTPVVVNTPVNNNNVVTQDKIDNSASKTTLNSNSNKNNNNKNKKFNKRKLKKDSMEETLSSLRKLPDLLLLQSASQSQQPTVFLILRKIKTKK
ncbi:hypothetical protein TNCV_1294141 [Trichonephila clavipes]|nr:hypothetical protein TNCV_1294141 [Trichonephila clavipes]